MLSENKFNMLLQRVVFDHEILTHRVVARSFKVDTTTAKKILGEFVQRSEGRSHATYIVTGFINNSAAPAASGQSIGSAPSALLTSSNESQANGVPVATNGDVAMSSGNDLEAMPSSSAPQAGPSSQAYVTALRTQEERHIDQFECIMLVPQEELQEKLPLFSTILSQEVYSAEPSKLPDLVLLTDANMPVLKDKDLAAIDSDVLGTIKHYRTSVKKSGKAGKASAIASTSKNTIDKSKDKSKGKEIDGSKAEKEKTDLKRKASAAELKFENTSKSTSTSKAPSPAATTKEKGKEKATSSKTSGPSLNDLFKSEPGAKKASTSDAKKLSKQPSRQAAAEEDFDDMLADDDHMMAEIDALDSKKSSKPSSQKASKPSSSQSKKEEKPQADKKEKITLQSGSRRRVRKVKKIVEEVNAKGYKVRKEVETEEEYTASDSDDDGPIVSSTSAASKSTKEKEKEKPKPKEKEQPAEKAKLEKKPSFTKAGSSSSQAKAKVGTGGQTSLAGFFGKPKPKK